MIFISIQRQSVSIKSNISRLIFLDKETIKEKYAKIIHYYNKIDDRTYENFAFFNALIFEFEDYPEYLNLINRVTDAVSPPPTLQN